MVDENNLAEMVFVEPACGEGDIVVTFYVQCMCVVPACIVCVCASIWICPGHNLYIYA